MSKYLALAAAAAILTGCVERDRVGPRRTDTHSVPLDNSELTRVELRMSAGEINVSGGAAALMDGDFVYNVASWQPRVEYHSTGVRSDLEIYQPPGVHTIGGIENRWDVRLNDGVLMDVIGRLGAGSARLDFGTLHLRSVEVDIGVGEVRLDLRGTPRRSYDVRINGGIGQATVFLPREAAITATATGGLGSIDVRGLEKRNDRWINAAQENSPIHIRVDVRGGIGEIQIIAE